MSKGGGAMSSTKAPSRESFPTWLPPDAKKACSVFIPLVALQKGRYMLQRLAIRPAMQELWRELKYFPNIDPGSLITLALFGWLSAMRPERRRRYAPPSLGPIDTISDHLSDQLPVHARAIADAIRATDPTIRADDGITDATLMELGRVAAFFEGEATLVAELINRVQLPRKAGARNAHQVAFVNHMCGQLWQKVGRRPYILVSILANTVFDPPEDEQWDEDRVKHCYHSRAAKKPVGNISQHSRQ